MARRLILSMVPPGEILGLNSVVSDFPYDITAEAQSPCMITQLQRQSFLDFLIRYPEACLNVARESS